jgi:hypothetical protein
MKKLYLSLILALLFCGNIFAATIDIEPDFCGVKVDGVENETQCQWTITSDNATGTTQEFRLTTKLIFGYVKATSIENESDKFAYWFSNLTGQDHKSVQTYIYAYDKEFYYARGYSPTANFRNRLDEKYTYYTQINSADATTTTGTTTILVTFGIK